MEKCKKIFNKTDEVRSFFQNLSNSPIKIYIFSFARMTISKKINSEHLAKKPTPFSDMAIRRSAVYLIPPLQSFMSKSYFPRNIELFSCKSRY